MECSLCLMQDQGMRNGKIGFDGTSRIDFKGTICDNCQALSKRFLKACRLLSTVKSDVHRGFIAFLNTSSERVDIEKNVLLNMSIAEFFKWCQDKEIEL